MRFCRTGALAVLLVSCALFAPGPADAQTPRYRDSAAQMEARVDGLLARMTLDEKAAQMQAIARVPLGPGETST